MNRLERIAAAQNTLDIIEQGFYEINGQRVALTEKITHAIEGSILYKANAFDHVFSQRDKILAQKPSQITQFEVTGETTLQAAQRLSGAHSKIMCLNFASAKNPGGGFLTGAQAQEESLARSSALYPCISRMKAMYDTNRHLGTCLYTDDMIYSPAVPVFKNDLGELLETCYTVDFITSPAVNAGVIRDQEKGNIGKIEPVMLARMHKLLSLAVIHECDILVLGAWGCGVFRNNPEDVARYFHQTLVESDVFKNAFQHIVFAVYSSGKDKAKEAFDLRYQILET